MKLDLCSKCKTQLAHEAQLHKHDSTGEKSCCLSAHVYIPILALYNSRMYMAAS